MSYTEYSDMFDAVQHRGSNKIVLMVDVVHSKTNPKYVEERPRIFEMFDDITENIGYKLLTNNKRLFLNEKKYFVLGDCFCIMVEGSNIKEVEKNFKDLFRYYKLKYEISLDFHINSGYYETDDYGLGGILYYSGYCVQELENRSKKNEVTI